MVALPSPPHCKTNQTKPMQCKCVCFFYNEPSVVVFSKYFLCFFFLFVFIYSYVLYIFILFQFTILYRYKKIKGKIKIKIKRVIERLKMEKEFNKLRKQAPCICFCFSLFFLLLLCTKLLYCSVLFCFCFFLSYYSCSNAALRRSVFDGISLSPFACIFNGLSLIHFP